MLPGLHLRYEVNDRTVLCGAYTETLSRPSFFAAAPRAEIVVEEDVGNPELEPLHSSNVDLAREYCPGKIYAVHDDGSIAAFDLRPVLAALKLPRC